MHRWPCSSSRQATVVWSTRQIKSPLKVTELHRFLEESSKAFIYTSLDAAGKWKKKLKQKLGKMHITFPSKFQSKLKKNASDGVCPPPPLLDCKKKKKKNMT